MNDLLVSEIFQSFQGEGPSAGVDCSFLRLAGCNLTCRWCDSPYTWDFDRYDYATEVQRLSLSQVAEQLRGCSTLVVTGGEPLIQHKRVTALLELLDRLAAPPRVEVETNGTIAPSEPLRRRVNQWNVSPKLSHAGDPLSRRIVRPALQQFASMSNAFLKLVVEQPTDLLEARALAADLSWPSERVYLMAQATSARDLAAREAWLADACDPNGFRLSPRLHIQRYGDRRGV